MLSTVWLATWPRLSPVTRHSAPVRAARRVANRIMHARRRRVTSSSFALSLIRASTGVKGTTCRTMPGIQRERMRARVSTFSRAFSEVKGAEWKYTASRAMPRLAIIQPATGESIPPESRSRPLPELPLGSP